MLGRRWRPVGARGGLRGARRRPGPGDLGGLGGPAGNRRAGLGRGEGGGPGCLRAGAGVLTQAAGRRVAPTPPMSAPLPRRAGSAPRPGHLPASLRLPAGPAPPRPGRRRRVAAGVCTAGSGPGAGSRAEVLAQQRPRVPWSCGGGRSWRPLWVRPLCDMTPSRHGSRFPACASQGTQPAPRVGGGPPEWVFLQSFKAGFLEVKRLHLFA